MTAQLKRLHLIAGCVILGAWTVSLLTGILTHDYEALDTVTPIMVIFAGYLFGDQLLRKRVGNGNGG